MESAITWLVIWGLLALFTAPFVGWLVAIAGVWLAVATDKEWIAPAGFVLGWLTGVAWFIFTLVQTILQLVTVIQLATAG